MTKFLDSPKVMALVNSLKEGYASSEKHILLEEKQHSVHELESEFLQYGVRFRMKYEDFADNVDNTILGIDFGREIRRAEFRGIVDKLKKVSRKQSITLDQLGREDLHTFSDILMPSSSLFSKMLGFYKYRQFSSREMGFDIAGKVFREHPTSEELMESDSLIFFNPEIIFWGRKTVEEMKSIPAITDFKSFSDDNDYLSIKMKDHENGQIEIYIHSVLAIKVHGTAIEYKIRE